MSEEVELPVLTLEELMEAGKTVVSRNLTIEVGGEKLARKVTFRRLTFQDVSTLGEIPSEEPERYIKLVVFYASVVPKFENVEQVSVLHNGFVQNYSRLILMESGKNPFLVKE